MPAQQAMYRHVGECINSGFDSTPLCNNLVNLRFDDPRDCNVRVFNFCCKLATIGIPHLHSSHWIENGLKDCNVDGCNNSGDYLPISDKNSVNFVQ